MKNNLAIDDLELAGSPKIWVAEFVITHALSDFFLEALGDVSDSIKCYEKVEDSGEWFVRVYFREKPDLEALQTRVVILAEAVSFPKPEVALFEIENKNWVLELAKQFKAIQTSEFHIFSQFSEPSPDKINIAINPGMAFGTGQHETTYLCLEAISWLRNNPPPTSSLREEALSSPLPEGGDGGGFKNILDLGCGSGILAIAASKIWNRASITASDNDPIAIQVCGENAEINSAKMKCCVSEGFAKVPAQKFDLILANILMNPLLQLAEDMEQFSSGVAVLSGFKTDQVQAIQEKYESLGFKHIHLLTRNDWVSLLLSK